MSFDWGAPPPPSKYTASQLGLTGGLCVEEVSSDEETDRWLVATEETTVTTSATNSSTGSARIYTSQEWLVHIEEKYLNERDDLVRQCFQAAFNNVTDTYAFLLHVVTHAFFDLYSKRVPITYYALDEARNWTAGKKEKRETIEPPTDYQKRSALEFVCHGGYNYFGAVNQVFQLDTENNRFLAEYINLENLTCKRFKEMVLIIQALHLEREFHGEQVMLPLIAFDQWQVLESYIENDSTLQYDYLCLLNELCAMPEQDMRDYIVMEKGLTVKGEAKLTHKTLGKIADKAVKRYNLNPDDFPEIFRSKNVASLNYLVKMRWQDEKDDKNLDKWDDLIFAAVSGKVWLQQHLIESYLKYDDLVTASCWVERVKLPTKHIPQRLRPLMTAYIEYFEVEEETSKETKVECSEDWEAEVKSEPSYTFNLTNGFMSQSEAETLSEQFHKLGISLSNVVLVDSVKGLKNSMKTLFKAGQVIGFDSEWKPSFGKAGEQDRAATLQLAVKEKVYIIDLYTLYLVKEAESTLKEFFSYFFTSKDVVKIGYGIVGDLKILISMFAYVVHFIRSSVNLVDLSEIAEKLFSRHEVIPYLHPAKESAVKEKGLSMLVSRTLGKTLDKTFQVSDWEKRPLTTEQIHYAALDAYCLLEVYEVLGELSKTTQPPRVNLVENVRLKWLKPKQQPVNRSDKYDRRKEREVKFSQIKPVVKGVPRASSSLKVVCDIMLGELASELRKCGVDAIALQKSQQSTIVQMSRRDYRAILTRGKSYFIHRGHVNEGQCMWVQEGTLKEQVKMIFHKYNVVLRSNDAYSRCVACNSDRFESVDSTEMEIAYKIKCGQLTPEQQHSNSLNLELLSLKNSVPINFDFLKNVGKAREFFAPIELFDVCCACGKVDWKGEHHDALRTKYADVIDKRETEKFYYAKPG